MGPNIKNAIKKPQMMLRKAPNFSNIRNRVPAHMSRHQTFVIFAGFVGNDKRNSESFTVCGVLNHGLNLHRNIPLTVCTFYCPIPVHPCALSYFCLDVLPIFLLTFCNKSLNCFCLPHTHWPDTVTCYFFIYTQRNKMLQSM